MLGLCGGYQMLGRRIADPDGLEGPPGACDGLGLLDVETALTGHQAAARRGGPVPIGDDAPFSGYEMHVGETSGPRLRTRPMLRFDDGQEDGAISRDGLVRAAYVHGFFRGRPSSAQPGSDASVVARPASATKPRSTPCSTG